MFKIRLHTPLFIIGFIALLAACSHQPDSLSNAPLSSNEISVNDSVLIQSRLQRFYRDHQNTQYRFGGLTSHGLDCSGLVYKAYREYLGWTVPRSTELQLKAGRQITLEELKPGDLVFYRPENKGMHVGIYFDDANGGRFLHASSSKGVIVSQIKGQYWTPFFYQARRIH
ncbi:MAG: C40 family peptidase [Sinobacterium sp.]|nr:C40 family peptidase [Sinobacterium sp.]